jgi:hypothetical protein
LQYRRGNRTQRDMRLRRSILIRRLKIMRAYVRRFVMLVTGGRRGAKALSGTRGKALHYAQQQRHAEQSDQLNTHR